MAKMTVGKVRPMGNEKRQQLEMFWPEAIDMWERTGGYPPLTDYELAANRGSLPEWVTDKYEVLRRLQGASTVGLGAVPHSCHAVVKPRVNPEGLATAAKVVVGPSTIGPDYLWQTLWYGRHLSVDIGIVRGRPDWHIVAEGMPRIGHFGQFAAWTVYSSSVIRDLYGNSLFADHCRLFTSIPFNTIIHNLRLHDFTGVINVEFILDVTGDWHVIEVHFRPSRCFGPLYGEAVRTHILHHMAGDEEAIIDGSSLEGGTVIPRPAEEPFMTATASMMGDKPGWRAGVEFYD